MPSVSPPTSPLRNECSVSTFDNPFVHLLCASIGSGGTSPQAKPLAHSFSILSFPGYIPDSIEAW